MADDKQSEIQLFYHFLGQRLESGEPTLSVDEAVSAFQDYQRDAEKLEADSKSASERAEEL